MSMLVKTAERQLTDCVTAAIRKAMDAGALPQAEIGAFKIEIPADRKNGDYATNAAMAHAKAFRTAPAKIAQAIIDNLSLEGTYFGKCEAAGPGFLNFTLSPVFYADVLCDIAQKRETYGHSDIGAGKSALVEFVSANPTGPMHVGNARGGALGDTLAELLTWAGWRTEREFYINDGGNQIEKFGLSLDIRYRQHFGDPVEMPEDSYHGQDIIDHAANFAALYGDKYLTVSDISPTITVIAADVDNIAAVTENVKTVLASSYPNAEFTISDAGSKMEAANKSNETLTLMLIAMASIVFIIGGIGIMNVLFVSVKERTQEIGILKAIGGSSKDILLEFLLEACFISLIGGILGVLLSFAVDPVLTGFRIRTEMSAAGGLLALAFSLVTGTVFGFYPAWKASRLVPVEALSSE